MINYYKTPYDAPLTELIKIRVDSAFLRVSTGEAFGDQQYYDSDWNEDDDD